VSVDLAQLVAPAHTAVVTQACRGAVMGPDAGLAELADLSPLATLTTTDELIAAWNSP
jgi:biuret amidohydrolase